MKHVLTRVAHDEKGYGDGLDDIFVCTCGDEIDANDIEGAFEHGQETAGSVVLNEVLGGLLTVTTLRGNGVEVINIDWDNLALDANNDYAVEEIDGILARIDELGVAGLKVGLHVGMPKIVEQLQKARQDYVRARA